MALFEYIKQVERFLHDSKQEMIDPIDIISYVNRARREVAMRSQSCRILTRITGAITGYSIVATGSGYTNPVVAVSAPDFPSGVAPYPNGLQATATALTQGGQIIGVNNVAGGAGYFQPNIVITDPTGSGATVAAITERLNVLNQGQEVYPFSGVNLSPFRGIGVVHAVLGISLLYTNYRYSLPVYSFSVYQARVRNYPFQYVWVPTMASQYGRGTGGSFYVYPLPSQTYQYELDCICLPSDLESDQDFEAIPLPWADAVPWLATSYAYAELQNLNASAYFEKKFDDWMMRYGGYAQPGRTVNPYGRYAWWVTAALGAASALWSSLMGANLC